MKDSQALLGILHKLKTFDNQFIEEVANQYLQSSKKSHILSLDDVFRKADKDEDNLVEQEEWGDFLKLIQSEETSSEYKDISAKDWGIAKALYNDDIDRGLHRNNIALFLSSEYVKKKFYRQGQLTYKE